MISLAIDTSNGFCSICLSKKGEIIDFINSTEANQQTSKLFVYIDELFAKNNINYVNIDNLIITLGPGSFTGVRIAVAAINGISLATQIPIIGISNFQVIAFESFLKYNFNCEFYVAMNAMREQLYIQKFNANMLEIGLPELINFDQLNNYKKNILLCDKITFALIERYLPNIKTTDYHQLDARNVTFAANYYYEMKLTKPINPIYIRPPDAKPNIS